MEGLFWPDSVEGRASLGHITSRTWTEPRWRLRESSKIEKPSPETTGSRLAAAFSEAGSFSAAL
jgi:hypothetical protein